MANKECSGSGSGGNRPGREQMIAEECGHDKRMYQIKPTPNKTVICTTRKLPSTVSLGCPRLRAAAAALTSATESVEAAHRQPSTV